MQLQEQWNQQQKSPDQQQNGKKHKNSSQSHQGIDQVGHDNSCAA
jgi:hypothetical protein